MDRIRWRRVRRLSLAGIAGFLPLLLRAHLVDAQTTTDLLKKTANTLPTVHAVSSTEATPTEATSAAALLAPTMRVQTIVDDVRARLSIPQEVVVSVVAQDKLLVSVERLQSRDGAFALAFERDFLDVLSEDELTAVVAHELGHVWIFKHHPFLQTEELANQVALRLVSCATSVRAYEKVC